MNTLEAINAMIGESGESRRTLSARMGKSPNYLASVIEQSNRKGGNVNSATLSAVAKACGYTLAAIPSDRLPAGALAIDPPEPVDD